WIPSTAGIVRIVWDFNENGPAKWLAAAKDFQGFDTGATVPPGTYTVRLHAGPRVLTAPLIVKPDPRAPWTQEDYDKQYAYQAFTYAQFDTLDTWLNDIDATRARITRRLPALIRQSGAVAAAVRYARAVSADGAHLEALLSSNPQNDEDLFLFAP